MKKRMSKKGAMELSMNTIVIIVIGVTLLVLGLVFVRGIFTKIGLLGTGAIEKAESELRQIETGETKINYLTNIDVKKGKSSNPTLRICNTDGTLLNPKLEAEQSGFYTGLSVTIKNVVIDSTTTSAKNIPIQDTIAYQSCLVIPTLVNSKATTIPDPNKQPFLTLTVKSDGNVYDSVGTIINVT